MASGDFYYKAQVDKRVNVVNVIDYGAVGDNTTDDAAAINAAITACPAGGTVQLIPGGLHVIGSPILIKNNITLRGGQGSRYSQYSGLPEYIKPKFGAFVKNANGSALILANEVDGWRLENITLSGVSATNTIGGNIDGVLAMGACKGVRINKLEAYNMSGHGIHTDSTSNGWPGGWEVDRLFLLNNHLKGWASDNSASAAFGFSDGTISISEAANNYLGGWYFNGTAGVDLINLRATWNTGGKGFSFIGPTGNLQLTACQTDRSVEDGFYFACTESSTGQPAPHTVSVVNCMASRDGRTDSTDATVQGSAGNWAGFKVVGVSTSSPHLPITFVGCTTHVTKGDSGEGVVSPAVGISVVSGRPGQILVNGCIFNGVTAPWADDNGALRGGGGSVYNLVNASAGTPVSYSQPGPPGDGTASLNPLPTDYGYQAWNYDPDVASGSTGPTAGVLYMNRVEVRKPVTVTKATFGIVTFNSAVLTAGNYVALYNSAGTRVAVTADLTSTITASGEFQATFASSVALTPGYYWVALLFNGSPLPLLARAQGQLTGLGQSQLTGATRRHSTYLTGQTTTPATVTLASTGSTANTYWVSLL